MKNVATVAIVADHRSTRELVANRLQGESHLKCIGLFPDAIAAIRRLPDLKPDIVLVDINMPGMEGIECIRELRPQLTDANFVILSDCNESDCVIEAFSAGAVGHLLKRSIVDNLIPAMEEVVRGGSPINGEIARKVVLRFHAVGDAHVTRIDKIEKLSGREMEVLTLLAHGRLCKNIADELGISMNTVNTYTRRIYEKLRVHSRAEAVAKYNRTN